MDDQLDVIDSFTESDFRIAKTRHHYKSIHIEMHTHMANSLTLLTTREFPAGPPLEMVITPGGLNNLLLDESPGETWSTGGRNGNACTYMHYRVAYLKVGIFAQVSAPVQKLRLMVVSLPVRRCILWNRGCLPSRSDI